MFDNIPVTHLQAKLIAQEVMTEEFKPILLENEMLKEELRLLREGHTMIIPHDVEHARAMFKMASFYLGQNDKEFVLEIK